MKKILRVKGDVPSEVQEEIRELAEILAGPNGTIELTPWGWVYENPDKEGEYEHLDIFIPPEEQEEFCLEKAE